MQVETVTHNNASEQRSYVVLPPEPDPEPKPFITVNFVAFTVAVITVAALAGLVQSGRIPLDRFTGGHKAVAQIAPAAPAAPAAAASPAATAHPSASPAGPATAPAQAATAAVVAKPSPPPLPTAFPPDTFVVSSISIGQPSFAIINGISRVKNELVETDKVKGWTVRQINGDSVVLQNDGVLETVPLNTPKFNALDDTLKPLN